MDNGKLIDLVCARDALWNPKSGFYHNRQMKHLLWTEIADQLGASLETVRTKWNCLRDSFRRELRKRQDGSSKAQWPFFNQMLFLTAAMTVKDYLADQEYNDNSETFDMIANPEMLISSGILSEGGNSNSEVPSTSEQTSTIDVIVKEEPSTSPQPSTAPTFQQPPIVPLVAESPNTRYIPLPPCRHQDYSKERRKYKEIRKKFKKEKERDEDYHFALSLVSSMKKVPDRDKIKMRMMVLDTISTFLVEHAEQPNSDNLISLHCGESSSAAGNQIDGPPIMDVESHHEETERRNHC